MKSREDKLYFGGHIVAFIDILGQSAKLSKLKKSKWWEFNQETLTALQETYWRVLRFREIFNGFLSRFCRPSVLDTIFQELSDPSKQETWNHFDQSRILVKGMSDSLVITFPLKVTNGLIPVKSIYGVLVACASSMLVSLNYRFAIRGAVEIGPCVYDPRSYEVYGSALNDSVYYEKEADWPRILVGAELVKYLEECTNLPKEPIAFSINSAEAHQCLSLLAQDAASLYYIDYLGTGFKKLSALKNKKGVRSALGSFEKINYLTHKINL